IASAISRRPWPILTTASPAKPSISLWPFSVHTQTPSAWSMTSSSSESVGWFCVLWVHRWLILAASVMGCLLGSMKRSRRESVLRERAAVGHGDLVEGEMQLLREVDGHFGRTLGLHHPLILAEDHPLELLHDVVGLVPVVVARDQAVTDAAPLRHGL